VRDGERVDALTLDEAVGLLAEKTGKEAPERAKPRIRTPRKPATKAAEPARGYVPVVKTGRSRLAPAKPKTVPKAGAKPKPKPAAPKSRAKATKKK
jgi:hypothetical protein